MKAMKKYIQSTILNIRGSCHVISADVQRSIILYCGHKCVNRLLQARFKHVQVTGNPGICVPGIGNSGNREFREAAILPGIGESRIFIPRNLQGRREAINIGGGGGSSCFDQHFLGF